MMFDALKTAGFDVLTLHHAEAILQHDMPDAVTDIETTLLGLKVPSSKSCRVEAARRSTRNGFVRASLSSDGRSKMSR